MMMVRSDDFFSGFSTSMLAPDISRMALSCFSTLLTALDGITIFLLLQWISKLKFQIFRAGVGNDNDEACDDTDKDVDGVFGFYRTV